MNDIVIIDDLKKDMAIKLAKAVRENPDEAREYGLQFLTAAEAKLKDISEDDIHDMERLSGKELVRLYGSITQELTSPIKDALFNLLKQVYKLNKKKIYTVSGRKLAEDLRLDYKYLIHIFRNLEQSPIRVEGDLIHTSYTWLKEHKPTLVDAEELLHLYNSFREFKLNNTQRKMIEKAPKVTPVELVRRLGIEDPLEAQIAQFKIQEYRKGMQVRTNRRDRENDPVVTSVETRTRPKNQENPNEEIQDTKQDDSKLPPSQMKDQSHGNRTNSEGSLFLMNQQLSLYKQMVEVLEKHNNVLVDRNMELEKQVFALKGRLEEVSKNTN